MEKEFIKYLWKNFFGLEGLGEIGDFEFVNIYKRVESIEFIVVIFGKYKCE